MSLNEPASSASSGDPNDFTGTRTSRRPSASARDAWVSRRTGLVSHCARSTAAMIDAPSAATAAPTMTLTSVVTVCSRNVNGRDSVTVTSRMGAAAGFSV